MRRLWVRMDRKADMIFLLPQNFGWISKIEQAACFPNKQAGRLRYFRQIQQNFALIVIFAEKEFRKRDGKGALLSTAGG